MMHDTVSLIVLSHQSAAVSDTDQWNNHVVFLNCFKSLLRGQEAHSTTFVILMKSTSRAFYQFFCWFHLLEKQETAKQSNKTSQKAYFILFYD